MCVVAIVDVTQMLLINKKACNGVCQYFCLRTVKHEKHIEFSNLSELLLVAPSPALPALPFAL